MRLTYHPEAEAELVEVAEFYEARSAGLGERFLQAYDTTVAEIAATPGLWPIAAADLRCRTMKRYPFSIYYRIIGDELRILVIKHHRRHPDYWRHRLDS